MNHPTRLAVLALGLASITACAATEYERTRLPEPAQPAARLELTATDVAAAPSFPRRLTAPSAPRAADRHAARVVAERGGAARTDVELCVGGDGAVTDVALVRGSGIDGLDAALIAEARGWRYQPLPLASATVCQQLAIDYVVK